MPAKAPIIVIVLIIFLASCGNKNNRKKQEGNQEIPVIVLETKDTFLHRSYVASIEATSNVELRNKVEGYLEKIYVDEGQAVKKGQLLFTINTDEYQAEVSRANAILSNAVATSKEAEVQMGRVKLLVDKDIISTSEMDVARAQQNAQKAKINEALSNLSMAKTRLSYTRVTAPFDGIIDRIPFKTGSLLSEGSLLTTVSDIRSVYAYFKISEEEYLKYLRDKLKKENHSSNKVQLNLADGSRYKYNGAIETMTSQFDQGTGSIAFRAKFPNPGTMLRHGSSGMVVLTTRADSVLMLPQKAVFEIQDRYYVYAVDSTNTIKMTSFTPLTRFANFYIVHAGLHSGDKIVYEGAQNLKDGITIKPKPVNMDSIWSREE